MGIYDFLALSDEKQWQTIWDKGQYVDTFKSIDSSYVLYAIDKFFVEVELCPFNDNIIGKSVFVHGNRMEKYTHDITDKGKPWD